MNNQRGGIISKIFVIPAGVALMVGFFFLGYYVGKYQSKSGAANKNLPPLPEIVSGHLPKQDEFTFYKTLTDKENKTVSLELKPKKKSAESAEEKKDAAKDESRVKKAQQPSQEKEISINVDKTPPAKQSEIKPLPAKKETALKQAPNNKLRYTIQIASYPEKGLAEEEVKNMKKRGYAAFIVSSEVPDKGMWYRVRLGSFSNKASAEKLQKELQTKVGLSPFITIE